jgi:hypothetical protein
MSGGTVAAGNSTYSSTIAVASTAEMTTFADRYGFIEVENGGTSGLLYVRADGQAATVAGNNCIVVGPNQTAVISNGLPLWFQSSKVIPQGAIEYPSGNTQQTGPAEPGMVTPMESLAGQEANPGTKVSVISSTASLPYTLAGTG